MFISSFRAPRPRRPGLSRSMRVALLFAVTLAACAPQPVPVTVAPDASAPAGFPERDYLRALEAGRSIHRVDAAASLGVVEVRRGGRLAFAGHDHVVASHDLRGWVDAAAGRADLYLRLDQLVVDEPELRAAAGFDTRPGEEAIAGTRRNMLERVLDAPQYPYLTLRVDGLKPAESGEARADGRPVILATAITLHGVTRELAVPAVLVETGGNLRVSGDFTLRQSDFGITPLSVLGGALQVQDALRLRFDIVARRLGGRG